MQGSCRRSGGPVNEPMVYKMYEEVDMQVYYALCIVLWINVRYVNETRKRGSAPRRLPALSNVDQPMKRYVPPPPRLTIVAESMSMSDMDGESQPSNERKRFWLPAATNLSNGAKRRKEHLDRDVTRPASDSTTDADVNVPAV